MSDDPSKSSDDNPPSELIDETRDHLAAVGSVASNWATLEGIIDSQSIALARISLDAGYCLTSQIPGSARKLNAYIALAQLRGAKKAIEALERFAKTTQQFSERRNRIVHDPWLLMIPGASPHRFEVTARRKLRSVFIEVPTEEVRRLSREILEQIALFISLDTKVRAEIAALRDKPR